MTDAIITFGELCAIVLLASPIAYIIYKRKCNRELAAERQTAARRQEREQEQKVIGDRIKREMLMKKMNSETIINTAKAEPIRKVCGYLSYFKSAQALLK